MMETEIQMLEVSPHTGRSKPSSRSSSSSSGGSIEYTSLRDVLVEDGGLAGRLAGHAGGSGPGSGYDIHDFDASNIGIRNQLLKHAASAYLQSAVIVRRDQGCLPQLWRRMQRRRRRVILHPCTWQGCVDVPVELCLVHMTRSARRLVTFLMDRVACMWA